MTNSAATLRAYSRDFRRTLMHGSSGGVVALVILSLPAPVHAGPAVAVAPIRVGQAISLVTAARPAAAASVVRPISTQQAIDRSLASQGRIDGIRNYVGEARAAAIAATRVTPKDGLNADGLDPVANAVAAALDSVGTRTWQGASAPVQTIDAGKYTVAINQTESRALLSWNRFDVGANTTVQFNQTLNGVAQPSWVAVNRIVGPQVTPTMILGSIKGEGTVVVLNQRGVIFGNGAQVNLHSLIASSLDIGNAVKQLNGSSAVETTSIADRNNSFLQNGLLVQAAQAAFAPQLLSSQATVTGGSQASYATTGDVIVDRGANIKGSGGGFVILAAHSVYNDGALSSANGQVNLQSGNAISFAASTGAAQSVDSDVRGLILRTADTTAGGQVANSGLIDVPTGYIALGAGQTGSVTNTGLLASTTSVARNGKISLTGGSVVLGGNTLATHTGAISILADTSALTIPQGTAAEPASFKSSVIEIGNISFANGATSSTGPDLTGKLAPANFTMAQNSLIFAPNANVRVGLDPGKPYDFNLIQPTVAIDIAAGATVDVSGIKNLSLDASRNSLLISPLKRNELRDTPTYRDPATGNSFTLNGATVYVDPRISGVREDGVAWIGSPLIEAGSIAGQIGITASEFMTKGGNVNLSVGIDQSAVAPSVGSLSTISIAKTAVIDFSGGFVHFTDGMIRTSKLITADGRVVDISEANPNDIFVAVGDGFTENQVKFGVVDKFANPLLQGNHFEAGYDEGRDAGSLTISAPAARLEGALYGAAFAGAHQTADAKIATGISKVAGDVRKVQTNAQQLPSGGFVSIGSSQGNLILPGADIIVYHGSLGSTPTSFSEILLSDDLLNTAQLSGLKLQTSGAVTFAGAAAQTLQSVDALTITGASNLLLAAGGALEVDAGRAIRFDGTVAAPAGRITAQTFELAGSPFRSDDDIPNSYAGVIASPGLFDITVNGKLSTAGRWVNDFGTSPDKALGSAWLDGGTISLTVAPKVFVAIGDAATATDAVDLSGSIFINAGAKIDVGAGGYVAPDLSLKLSAKGGNVSLVNDTTYARLTLQLAGNTGDGDPTNFLQGTGPTAPVTTEAGFIRSRVVPSVRNARVIVAADTVSAFGFGGSGTFSLVTPEASFGVTGPASSTFIPLDFIQRSGFGTLDLQVNHARVLNGFFNNGVAGQAAFFDTTQFVIGAGQTLDLTQSSLPFLLDSAQRPLVYALSSGSDIKSILKPQTPVAAFDRHAANLKLGGFTELVVERGGLLTGAAGASVTVAKLYSEGTIRIAGGKIVQSQDLPFNVRLLGLTDTVAGSSDGLSQIFGGPVTNGLYSEDASTNAAAGLFGPDGTTPLTNYEALTKVGFDQNIYFTGILSGKEGVRLASGSVTDLSGTAIFNPRAGVFANGTQQVTGYLVDGGSISTASAYAGTSAYFSVPGFKQSPGYVGPNVTGGDAPSPLTDYIVGRTFTAETGSTINLDGTSAVFDTMVAGGNFAGVNNWSNGGTLSVLSGGSITGSKITAKGGAAAATGGTIEWTTPVLVQTEAQATGTNYLAADQITAAGFDSFVARGSVTSGSDFRLKMDKAFLLQAQAPALPGTSQVAAVTVSSLGNFDATIVAPYVSLTGTSQTANAISNLPTGTASFTFNAGAIDLAGAVLFAPSIGSASLTAQGDIRLIGVKSGDPLKPSLSGQVLANGDLHFAAAQVYATTGTGNLQALIEGVRAGKPVTVDPFLIASSGANATVSFARTTSATPAIPLSAGSYLRVLGANIVQDGVLRTPLGRLELGSNEVSSFNSSRFFVPATETLTFGGADQPFGASVTSVSGSGVKVPYGTTTDGIEYYFSPNTASALTAAPVGELRLRGGMIDVDTGATIDTRGGGSVVAYEFASGTGGSRDVLSRFNTDSYSSNGLTTTANGVTVGYQYADGRQVYAIVPVGSAPAFASFDPIFSADYQGADGSNLYGLQAGQSVYLDAAPGIAAGEYILLPAQYALTPGALRLVENVGAGDPTAGSAVKLLDGSVIVGGSFGTAGTDFRESTRRSFTVQTQSAFSKYSQITQTDGATKFDTIAKAAGAVTPRSPLDAARVILSPLNALRVAGLFQSEPAAGGRGSQVDIGGTNILIADGAAPVAGTLVLTSSTINNLKATSLLIGGERTDNADGTTALGVLSNHITVGKFADGVPLSAAELLFVVGGEDSSLTVSDGAVINATGLTGDQRTGDYVITSDPASSRFDATGVGSLLRVANGSERLVTRTGDLTARNSLKPSTLAIGDAIITGAAMALDTTRNLNVADGATFNTPFIALSGDLIRFDRLGINSVLEAKLAAATQLTLRSSEAIVFSAGSHDFNNLRLDTTGIGATPRFGLAATLPADVVINAKTLTFGNTGIDRGGCVAVGLRGCGAGASSLTVNATEIVLGSGQSHTYGFDKAVTLSATNGVYYEGKGGLQTNASNLTLITPFIAERTAVVDPRTQAVIPDYALSTAGSVTIRSKSTGLASNSGAPGARFAIGKPDAPVSSITIDGTAIRATAGTIDLQAQNDIVLTGGATLAVPGFTKTFGDTLDSTTISAGGGLLNLLSKAGSISLGTDARLIVDTGIGTAGAINLLASHGSVDLGGALNPGLSSTTARTASLTIDAGTSAFDLSAFVTRYGNQFGGDLQVRAGAGSMELAAGQIYRANSVSLTTEAGSILIAGTIDTSGVNGGAISLFGHDGLTLASTALLDTHANGFAETDSRKASGGAVTLGIGSDNAVMNLTTGARIDASARRPGNRLVGSAGKDPSTLLDVTNYTFVEGDTGGIVTLRAAVLGINNDLVDIHSDASIVGASQQVIEGFKRYDLNAIAGSGNFGGITDQADGVHLDAGITGGQPNFLADAAGPIVSFVQKFNVAAKDGSSLTGFAQRPGVELNASGDIILDSNWNLGAGSIRDIPGAIAAGLLRLSPLGNYTVGPNIGKPRYEVVPGKENELFQRFVDLTYRVGGKVNGLAPAVTIRAGGTLDIKHSISDGFFSFADKTDPGYVNYQLGGGDRNYHPALTLSCAGINGDCGSIATLTDVLSGGVQPVLGNTISIATTTVRNGSEDVRASFAPYSAAANSAGATGEGEDGAGDPFGGAVLFPLLADGTAVDSSNLRLVGGTGGTNSVNPLMVDRSSAGKVIVEGETSYSFTPTRGTIGYSGNLEFRYLGVPGDDGRPQTISISDLLAGTESGTLPGSFTGLSSDSLVRLNFGGANTTAEGADTREAALAFFAADRFSGPTSSPFSVIASLSEALAFYTDFGPKYAANVASGVYQVAPFNGFPLKSYGGKTYVRSLVRTGTGSIDIAAAGDVVLLATDKIVYRNDRNAPVNANAPGASIVGGTAVYTAGRRVDPAIVAARIAGTSNFVNVIPNSATPIESNATDYVPTYRGQFESSPVFATGGGSISVSSGGDVIGRRDIYSENYLDTKSLNDGVVLNSVGSSDQRWRVGHVGMLGVSDTEIRIQPQYFSSGIGALAGGDVSIRAAGNVTDLTVALDNTVIGGSSSGARTLVNYGGGSLLVNAGGSIVGGQFDFAAGYGIIRAQRDIGSTGIVKSIDGTTENLLRVRVANADVTIVAGGKIDFAGVGALAAGGVPVSEIQSGSRADDAGYYSPVSALSLTANGSVKWWDNRKSLQTLFDVGSNAGRLDPIFHSTTKGSVLPGSLTVAALRGDLDLGGTILKELYPSAIGQLGLFSGGDIKPATLYMSDANPTLLPGAFSVVRSGNPNTTITVPSYGLNFGIPLVRSDTSENTLRFAHNQTPTHLGDTQPIRIVAEGSILNANITVPKQARISAGIDIVGMTFDGQNVGKDDVTRITAGRDITATTTVDLLGVPSVVGNNFTLGGPGAFFVEAGRNMGPFLTSTTTSSPVTGVITQPGGIRTIGNDENPWLAPQGAKIYALYGVSAGLDYAALSSIYLDPANAINLDGDLFAQNTDVNGNKTPDRTRPIYVSILAQWLIENQPATATAILGAGNLGTATLRDAAAYSNFTALFNAFSALPALTQSQFLLDRVYFNELAAAANPNGDSYLQFIRGYRAVEALFPADRGYTNNLATYYADPATISADHPQGQPTKILANPFTNAALVGTDGKPLTDASKAPLFIDQATGRPVAPTPLRATRVVTGSVDLRLSTIQSTRGGDVTILGPGGDFIAGSVVRTSAQAALRSSGLNQVTIPIAYEGVLTFRNGAIRSFSDGDFRLNQSRLFTLGGGDVTMWSSNGDLNAGQGPKSAANSPPVTLRFTLDGFSEVDSTGSVSGAGIAAFTPPPEIPVPNVVLIAPVGEVDAGDAGVRAGGDIFVAAARVANADNFKAGGQTIGVPSGAPTAAPSLGAAANSAIAANVVRGTGTQNNNDQRSRISVDVLGFGGTEDACKDKDGKPATDCNN